MLLATFFIVMTLEGIFSSVESWNQLVKGISNKVIKEASVMFWATILWISTSMSVWAIGSVFVTTFSYSNCGITGLEAIQLVSWWPSINIINKDVMLTFMAAWFVNRMTHL